MRIGIRSKDGNWHYITTTGDDNEELYWMGGGDYKGIYDNDSKRSFEIISGGEAVVRAVKVQLNNRIRRLSDKQGGEATHVAIGDGDKNFNLMKISDRDSPTPGQKRRNPELTSDDSPSGKLHRPLRVPPPPPPTLKATKNKYNPKAPTPATSVTTDDSNSVKEILKSGPRTVRVMSEISVQPEDLVPEVSDIETHPVQLINCEKLIPDGSWPCSKKLSSTLLDTWDQSYSSFSKTWNQFPTVSNLYKSHSTGDITTSLTTKEIEDRVDLFKELLNEKSLSRFFEKRQSEDIAGGGKKGKKGGKKGFKGSKGKKKSKK